MDDQLTTDTDELAGRLMDNLPELVGTLTLPDADAFTLDTEIEELEPRITPDGGEVVYLPGVLPSSRR